MTQQRSSSLTLTTPSDREIVMIRTFQAPRALVFEAHSKPELMQRWWGPRRYELPVAEMDFRPGGAYHFVQRGADGQEFGFRGKFLEIVPPERITWTFEFEGMPGHISIERLTLDEQDGTTTLTSAAVFDSKEDRDGMLASGCEEGAAESYDRLDELLRTMR